MAVADYRLLTEATGQRIAAALEALSGTGAAAAAARTNLDVYSKGETDTAIAQSTATITGNILGDSKILTSTYTSTMKIPAITTLGFLVHDYGGTVSAYALYGGRCDLIAGTGGITTDGNAGGQTLTFPNSGTNRVMLIYR
jgi:hypothetical protein